jgi:glycosyltransferase involved in cell wall biosynthesis
MLHAQSVDEYDFTYQMREWMKPIEIGISKRMTGIFVGSTIHKDQLRNYGFDCPIHVVSLPYGKTDTLKLVKPGYTKKNQVIFASRLDKEKNPYFLLEVIKKFLTQHHDWEWVITTSGSTFRSNLPGVVEMFEKYAREESRFKLLNDLSKEEYYTAIAESKIMFNSSLQDYVSWTSIEAHTFDTKFICPNFRSFPDFCDSRYMYKPFDVDQAVSLLSNSARIGTQSTVRDLSNISDLGRHLETYIIVNGLDHEVNIWHEYEYCKNLIGK